MCSQGQFVVKLCLPLLAGRLSNAQVTNTGQVCAPVSEHVKAPLMSDTMYIAKRCVRLSACARPAVWHSAVSGAKPRTNVQAQASLQTTGMLLGCSTAPHRNFFVCVCVLYWKKYSVA